MAKLIQFVSPAFAFAANIEKVDRNKLYGWVDTKAYDAEGRMVRPATLIDDGRTIVPSGGIALKLVDGEGREVSRRDLVAVTQHGALRNAIPSIFDREVELRSGLTIDDYLTLAVKSVYQLTLEQDSEPLHAALDAGQLFAFDFNYRTDYEADTAFIVKGDGAVFAVVGTMIEFDYLTLAATAATLSDAAAEDEDEIDFGML
jgi:hypothetical protein